MTNKEQGIINKYIISKTDGSPIDDGAEYFVLRLDNGGGDPKHIAACRRAILTYAGAIKKHLPKLAIDIQNRYAPKALETNNVLLLIIMIALYLVGTTLVFYHNNYWPVIMIAGMVVSFIRGYIYGPLK